MHNLYPKEIVSTSLIEGYTLEGSAIYGKEPREMTEFEQKIQEAFDKKVGEISAKEREPKEYSDWHEALDMLYGRQAMLAIGLGPYSVEKQTERLLEIIPSLEEVNKVQMEITQEINSKVRHFENELSPLQQRLQRGHYNKELESLHKDLYKADHIENDLLSMKEAAMRPFTEAVVEQKKEEISDLMKRASIYTEEIKNGDHSKETLDKAEDLFKHMQKTLGDKAWDLKNRLDKDFLSEFADVSNNLEDSIIEATLERKQGRDNLTEISKKLSQEISSGLSKMEEAIHSDSENVSEITENISNAVKTTVLTNMADGYLSHLIKMDIEQGNNVSEVHNVIANAKTESFKFDRQLMHIFNRLDEMDRGDNYNGSFNFKVTMDKLSKDFYDSRMTTQDIIDKYSDFLTENDKSIISDVMHEMQSIGIEFKTMEQLGHDFEFSDSVDSRTVEERYNDYEQEECVLG